MTMYPWLLVALAAISATGTATGTPVPDDSLPGVAVGVSGGDTLLRHPGGERRIPPQPLRSETASPLFDALFALAQAELAENRVEAIADWAFNHGQPLPCDCYQAGEQWNYVWTRDLAFATDLALARLDPEGARRSLRFKLSDPRVDATGAGLQVAQDTGSGGSWPVSTDRVAWFLGARHLLDDPGFADAAYRALAGTLELDREYAFDADAGLYRGETSFLDWREQSYPAWTARDVAFIAESFALSTNVLHYEALRLAADLAALRGDARATRYRGWAKALRRNIDRRFWRADRGLYASYLGPAGHPVRFEAYDLLGTSLAVLAGVAPPRRARLALSRYPVHANGSPAIWPQRGGVPIYHNRAMWPFASAYALRAARVAGHPARIAHELRTLMRGAALAGSHMENYELTTQAVRFENGALGGPVVNSRRQLWSVAGYIAAVVEGVFGVEADGKVAPRLPVELVPMLFGGREAIHLHLADRRITLRRPPTLRGDLLVAGAVRGQPGGTIVDLVPRRLRREPLRHGGERIAPAAPAAPGLARDGRHWRVEGPAEAVLYVDGERSGRLGAGRRLPPRTRQQCLSLANADADGLESLHGPAVCVGDAVTVAGEWPRRWVPGHGGRHRVRLRYANANGPINTGITAAVKRLRLQCAGRSDQVAPVVMPHSDGGQDSTAAVFEVAAGDDCRFALEDGFNMSYLRHFARYTGGEGGEQGPLNAADVGALVIAPIH